MITIPSSKTSVDNSIETCLIPVPCMPNVCPALASLDFYLGTLERDNVVLLLYH